MADYRGRLPTLSNEAQLQIMELVKSGMSIDEALDQAQKREAAERSAGPKAPGEKKKDISRQVGCVGPPGTQRPRFPEPGRHAGRALFSGWPGMLSVAWLSGRLCRRWMLSRRWCKRGTYLPKTPFATRKLFLRSR